MGNKFTNTEELMEHLKKQIVQYSNGEDVAFDNDINTQELLSSASEDIELNRLKHEVERNNLLWNVNTEQPITSHRKGYGKFIVLGKKIVRKLLRWYVATPFRAQAEFNGSVTRSFNEARNLLLMAKVKIEELSSTQQVLTNKIISLEDKLSKQQSVLGNLEKHSDSNELYEELSQRLGNNEELLDKLQKTIITVEEAVHAVDSTAIEQKNTLSNFIFPRLDEINGRMHFNEERLRSELNFLNYRIKKNMNSKLESLNNLRPESELDLSQKESLVEQSQFDYLLFENRFRGSNEDIRNRQLKYLPYFENKSNVLDIGCGRGEFLELLLNSNITAKGIDMTDEMVEYCQHLGLPVENWDAIEYLQQQNDHSLGGIFLGQVIEHIPFDSIISLVELAWKKLTPGSYLIMETPNPQTLAIFNRSFYMDPTHVKPVHPLTIQFLTESVGFRESKILYSGRVEKEAALPHIQSSEGSIINLQEVNDSIDRLNDLLYGDQDYALIARK